MINENDYANTRDSRDWRNFNGLSLFADSVSVASNDFSSRTNFINFYELREEGFLRYIPGGKVYLLERSNLEIKKRKEKLD